MNYNIFFYSISYVIVSWHNFTKPVVVNVSQWSIYGRTTSTRQSVRVLRIVRCES